ncbi:MAG: dihydrodipicolinate synthase family protein [Clostridiales bacterium]|nr:dihydrodipicolinate synthase family protein [Clostridiales bacterium]
MKSINQGTYPTMITPFTKDRKVDYTAVENLVEWYWEKNCDGIFASCQSSEIWYLPLEDRVKLAKVVADKANTLSRESGEHKRMSIVASGHVSESFDDQVYELRAVAETGVDAVVLISNRMDIENTSDERWIEDTQKLIDALPDWVNFGIYECPKPYKRLLTPKMIKWISETGRFSFIKDTCCDLKIIKERLKLLEGSAVQLFNANSQTLLGSLRSGAHGFCGVMSNFHPQLYVWLCENFKEDPDTAEYIQSVLGISAFVENVLAYPVIAKYHLDRHEGVNMEMFSLSRDCNELTDYQKGCIDQLNTLITVVVEGLDIA